MLRGYKNLQSLLGLHAELDRARSVVEDGSRTALRFGDPHHIGWFQVERALFAYLGGDWDEAAESFRDFLDNLGERDHYMIGPAQFDLGRIEVERGQVVEGVRRSTVGLDFARGVKDHQLLMPALASHACVLIRAGRATEAHPVLDEYLGLVDFPDSSVVDAAIALTLLDRAHDFSLRGTILTTPWGTAAAAFARAELRRARQLASRRSAPACTRRRRACASPNSWRLRAGSQTPRPRLERRRRSSRVPVPLRAWSKRRPSCARALKAGSSRRGSAGCSAESRTRSRRRSHHRGRRSDRIRCSPSA